LGSAIDLLSLFRIGAIKRTQRCEGKYLIAESPASFRRLGCGPPSAGASVLPLGFLQLFQPGLHLRRQAAIERCGRILSDSPPNPPQELLFV